MYEIVKIVFLFYSIVQKETCNAGDADECKSMEA